MTPEAWPETIKAEQEYLALRADLIEALDVDAALSRGLRNPHTRGLALEMMFDLSVDYIKKYAAEVFDDATSTGGHFDLGRDLLARLEFGEATEILRPLLEERLATDDNTWEAYLRSAEVLGELGQAALLDYVVTRARSSIDPDILMTAEMFDSGSFKTLDRVGLRKSRGRPF